MGGMDEEMEVLKLPDEKCFRHSRECRTSRCQNKDTKVIPKFPKYVQFLIQMILGSLIDTQTFSRRSEGAAFTRIR